MAMAMSGNESSVARPARPRVSAKYIWARVELYGVVYTGHAASAGYKTNHGAPCTGTNPCRARTSEIEHTLCEPDNRHSKLEINVETWNSAPVCTPRRGDSLSHLVRVEIVGDKHVAGTPKMPCNTPPGHRPRTDLTDADTCAAAELVASQRSAHVEARAAKSNTPVDECNADSSR